MGDRSAEASVQVDFKIEPTLIPSTAIKRLATFPHGSGGLGDVWKCSMSTPSGTRPVAVKSIRVKQSNDSELLRRTGNRIRREAYIWIQLSHDRIVPLEGIILDHDFGPLPALVSLWMENGTLNEYLKREFPQLSDQRKLDLIQQVAAGLSYLHGKEIAHGDLTPNNILLDCSRNLRLTDFGLSVVVPESGNVTFGSVEAGKTRWMAPEFVAYANDSEESQSPPKPTKAGDIYSFGCVMLQIFTGEEPYSQIKTMVQVIRAMWLGQKPFCEVEINIDEAYKLLSSWCLSMEPETRPSVFRVTTIVDLVKALAVASRPVPTRIFRVFENLSPSQNPTSSVREVEGKINEQCFPRSAVSLIAALEPLNASVETKDLELARAVTAILPNMQSSGETAQREISETAANNVQPMDAFLSISPRPSTPTHLHSDNIRILGRVKIHFLLAYHPHASPIKYDVSRTPNTAHVSIQASPVPLCSHRRTQLATNPPIKVFTLKSDLLPWCCVIRASTHHYITVEDVLYQLYRFLCISATREEYRMIPNQDVRDQIVESYRRRCSHASSAEQFVELQQKGLKRVDFLVGRTTFMGLSSTKLGPDVWVLNLQ